MKKYYYIILFITTLSGVYSQKISFPIAYNLFLNHEKLETSNDPALSLYTEAFINESKKRDAMSITYSRFNKTELKNLFGYFVKHVEINGLVKTYFHTAYCSGIPIFSNGIVDMKDSKLFKWNANYYLDQTSFILEWKNGYIEGKAAFDNIHMNYEGNFLCDTSSIQYPYPPYDTKDTVFCYPAGTENMDGLGFTEIWNFEAKSGKFIKNIELLTLRQIKYGAHENLLGTVSLLTFKSTSKTDNKNIIKENVKYDVFFDFWNTCDPYTNGESCDIIKSDYSMGSSTRNNINPENRTLLLINIFKAIKSGSLVAMDAKAFDSNIEKLLSIEQVYQTMITYDTIAYQSPYPPYDNNYNTMITYNSMPDFIGIRFIEDWYFEPNKFNFYKSVKSFALLFAVYDRNTGEFAGFEPLFYLK